MTECEAPQCPWCEEPILPGDRLSPDGILVAGVRRDEHLECAIRAVIGGVNHQLGKCRCCGGNEPPDPPNMTRREAAQAAFRHWLNANDEEEA